jgi:HSP20 family protein
MADPTNELPAKSEERDTKTPERSREWEPFQNLRREIDRVFENFHHGLSAFGRTRTEFEPFRLLAGGWGSTPAITMIEKENAYELTAELPGMDESNVELKVAGGVLTIKGEKKEEKEEKSGDYVLSERRFGSIQRSIPLPEGIDLERIEASFKKGVLTVTMPKTPEAQKSERKIAIKGG